jgi:hypothetical protein
VVRQRLAYQAEQVVLAQPAAAPVSDAELARYHRAHAARYTVPARYSFTQVFLSRSRRGQSLERDARALAARLQKACSGGERVAAHGDPSLLPGSLDDVDAATIDARFGPGFAAALGGVEPSVWSGPIASSYGVHLVCVRANAAAALVPLATARERVLADYRHDRRAELLAKRVRELRAAYRVDVQRVSS